MRFVLCAIVAAVIYGVPSLADRQQTIRAIFGDDTNVTRAEAILAEEAQKLGITVDDYFNSCAGWSQPEFTSQNNSPANFQSLIIQCAWKS